MVVIDCIFLACVWYALLTTSKDIRTVYRETKYLLIRTKRSRGKYFITLWKS